MSDGEWTHGGNPYASDTDVWDEGGDHSAPDTLPEGKYTVRVCSLDVNSKYMGLKKAYLHCEVIEPAEYAGCQVNMHVNLGHKIYGTSSKLYKQWVVANGGKRPARRDRMSLRVFKDGIFTCSVRHTPKGYPVIDTFIERVG